MAQTTYGRPRRYYLLPFPIVVSCHFEQLRLLQSLVVLRVPSDTDHGIAQRLLEKAEAMCLISITLNITVELSAIIKTDNRSGYG